MRSLKSLWPWGLATNDNALNVQALPHLSAPETAGPSDEKSLRERLMQDFTRARYGAVCRTLAFPGVVDGTCVYYRAVAADTILSQWVIQRVTESSVQMETNNLPVQTDNAKFDVVKTGLDFFHAIEYLARTETSQNAPSVGPTRDDLKLEHYESFAKLHVIGFDLKGMPQPTMNGQIVTGGSYSKAMMDDLQKSLQDTDTKAVLAQKAWEGALANTGKPETLYKETLVQAQDLKDLSIAADLSKLWVDVFDRILQSDNLSLSRGERDEIADENKFSGGISWSSVHYWLSNFIDGFENRRVEGLYEQSDTYLDSIKAEKVKASIAQFVKDIACFAIVQDAAFYLHKFGSDPRYNMNGQMQDYGRQYALFKIGYRPNRDLKNKIVRLQWDNAEKKERSEFAALVASTPKIQAVPAHFVEAAQQFDALRMQAQYESERAVAKIRRGPIGGTREWI